MYVYDKLTRISYGVSCQSVVINLYQRTPIVTFNKRIIYYAYYTYQSGSYVIETDWLEIFYVLSESRTYSGPRPRLLALNQALPQVSQVTCITRHVTCVTCINRNRDRTGYQSPHGNLAVKSFFSCAIYPRST